MIRVTGTLSCATLEEAAIVAALLPEHIRLSRAEPGCLDFSVTPATAPLIWELDETFTDRAAFEAHQTRTRASEWFRATAHLARDFQVSDTL
ncbi:antibiotic biosynthesis monooxygenase [Tabrizicola sp.]|uniref:putative quinol monooxygenase n=1 Tax=Tabrizicola sp. TaxID=2005166 RepID=UPI0026277ECE|nr:antibiotic biosynthesis monooxygenase [Tabrizicola sp.]MDM7930669.1 antibiotic biosynthesis monooxygenase [Tabrizicola sp.]